MIAEFEDFCLWVYVVVDELWRQLPPRVQAEPRAGAGVQRQRADRDGAGGRVSRLAAGDDAAALLAGAPRPLPGRPRAQPLQSAAARPGAGDQRDPAGDAGRRSTWRRIASAPSTACRSRCWPSTWCRARRGPATWRAAGADFGKVPTKKQTIFGDKLHLLVTLGGVIRDFALAPASASDVAVGADLLREHADLTVLGDKGYISAPLADELRAERARRRC